MVSILFGVGSGIITFALLLLGLFIFMTKLAYGITTISTELKADKEDADPDIVFRAVLSIIVALISLGLCFTLVDGWISMVF